MHLDTRAYIRVIFVVSQLILNVRIQIRYYIGYPLYSFGLTGDIFRILLRPLFTAEDPEGTT